MWASPTEFLRSPKESAEPQSQKYQEWVDLKSPTDQQRLRNLALNGGQRKIRACHSDHLPKGIEGYNGHQRNDEHGGRRACIRNVVENRRHGSPEVWRRHAPGPHRQARCRAQSNIDESCREIEAPHLGTDLLDNVQHM